MSVRRRLRLEFLVLGAVPVLAAMLGCDPQAPGPVLDAIGEGITTTITNLTQAVFLTLAV